MKITDQQLMQAIWHMQLKQLASRVLDRYVGGCYATREDDDFNQFHSSYMHGTMVITELSDSQRRIRIKRLIAAGYIYQTRTSRSFCIQTPQATQAFQAARQFFLDKGVPVFVYKQVEPVPLNKEVLKCWQDQCEAHLINLFGELTA
jgi:hypothetical protein